jgi:DNA-binding winged helix-turn-helix (wHTH) protein/tetratricopeptide (TPR) repeat protein
MSRNYQHFYDFGPFRADALRHVLLHQGAPLALTPKAFETLLVLLQNSGRALGKDELLQTIWPDTFVEEATLAQNIFTLRKVFNARVPGVDQYIQTIPKVGYRFVVTVREVKGESGSLHVEQFGGPENIVKFEENSDWYKNITSLAVLPIADDLAELGMEHVGDSIMESIVNKLSSLPNLQVKACSTVARYKGREVDPQEAGRELGVDAILIGSILPFGDKTLIKVELVEVANGWQLWGEQYDQKRSEFVKVHQEIAKDISEKLCLRLLRKERRRRDRTRTENREAHRLYLKGRFFLNKRTEESFHKAIEAFQQAIEIDPEYSLAYTGLADAYLQFDYYGVVPPWETIQKAKAAAVKAIQLDDDLAEAHNSFGAIKLVYDREPASSELEFQKAIRLNPNYAPAHNGYAHCLMEMGQLEESLAECRLALELEPLDLENNLYLAWHYLSARQYDQAIEQLNRVLEIGPNFSLAHFLLGIAYEQKRECSKAIAELQRTGELASTPILSGFLGYTYAMAGRKDEAVKLLAHLLQKSKRSYVPPYSLALIYTGLGQRTEAVEWLEKAYIEQSRWRSWLKLTPELDSLRSEPEFTEFLQRAGFNETQV